MKISSKKLYILLFTFAIFVIIIGGFWFWNSSRTEFAEKGRLKIGVPELRIALPVYVAYENGYFTNNGLDIELVKFPTAQPMMDALVSGNKEIEVAGYCALPITFSSMGRSKTQLIFLTSMIEDDKHPVSVLVVKKDSEIRSVRDLAGKIVGILPTRAYEVWLNQVLQTNGVDSSTVIKQQIPPPLEADALKSGSVDALFTNDPAATAAVKMADGMIIPTGKALVPEATKMTPFYFGSFNITKNFADENPETVAKIAKSLDEAIIFIQENQSEAKNLLKKHLGKQAGLIKQFPDSAYKTTNQTTKEDLVNIYDYYQKQKILTVDLEDIKNSQYQIR